MGERSDEQVREQLRGLRNLEKGYSLAYAVDFVAREHGFHVLDELERLLAQRDRDVERDALDRAYQARDDWKQEAERLREENKRLRSELIAVTREEDK